MKTRIPFRPSLVAVFTALTVVSLHAAPSGGAPATDFKFQFGAGTTRAGLHAGAVS